MLQPFEIKNDMISDKQMISLGFVKTKTYKPKRNGVSSYCWYKNGFILTIEKDLGRDDGDEFQPTFKYYNYHWWMTDFNKLKALLKLLNI